MQKFDLLSVALELPIATESDFMEGSPLSPQPGDKNYRVVSDAGLRSLLVKARAAEAVQVPRGRQAIKSIIRVYPDFDAPVKTPVRRASNRPRVSAPSAPLEPFVRRGRKRRAAVAKKKSASRATYTVTPEQMAAILERVRALEKNVAEQLEATLDAEVSFLQERLAGAREASEVQNAYDTLGGVLKKRARIPASARVEAFRLVRSDETLEGRDILQWLSAELPGL